MFYFLCPTCCRVWRIPDKYKGEKGLCKCGTLSQTDPSWLAYFAKEFIFSYYRTLPLDGIAKVRMTPEELTLFWEKTVEATAKLMGIEARFEIAGLNINTKQHFDGVLRSNHGKMIAPLEWEFKPIDRRDHIPETLNEFRKLKETCSLYQPEFGGYIGYAENEKGALQLIHEAWVNSPRPLLLIIVYFIKEPILGQGQERKRVWKRLCMYELVAGQKTRKFFDQCALPWEVPGSRWQREYLEFKREKKA